MAHGVSKSWTHLSDFTFSFHFHALEKEMATHSHFSYHRLMLLTCSNVIIPILQAVVVQLLSCVQFFATPWTVARQASLSFTISQSFLKLMSIESVMPSSHLILCRPLLLLPSIFPSIRVFSNESALHIR